MRALAAMASDAAISWCCCTSVSSTSAIALLLNGPIFSSGAERVGGRAGRADQVAHRVVDLIARQPAGRREARVERAVAGHAGGDGRIDGAAAAADAGGADVAGAARDAGDRTARLAGRPHVAAGTRMGADGSRAAEGGDQRNERERGAAPADGR